MATYLNPFLRLNPMSSGLVAHLRCFGWENKN